MFTKTIEYKVLPAVAMPSRQVFIDPSGHVILGMRIRYASRLPYKQRVHGMLLQRMADKLGLYESMKMCDRGTMTVEYHFGIARRVKGTLRRITF